MARADDDDGGFALKVNDELLLHVFVSYLDMADVLRCAATCKRWRRLITSEAEFICRHPPPSGRRFAINAAPAVGFFHHLRQHDYTSGMAPLQFLPPSFSRRASPVFDANLTRNSRLVASRNGRRLLEVRGAAARASLTLAVCNAMTGAVFALPALPNRPQHYACALLAAADLRGAAAVHPVLRPAGSSAAAFLVLILYMRGGATFCRSCSSATNAAWGPEGQVSHANIRNRQLGEMDAGVAVGGIVFWLSGNKVVFGLRVDTLQGRVESPKWYGMHSFGFSHPYPDRRLVVLPDGQLGAVQVGRGDAGSFVIDIFSRNDDEKRRCLLGPGWDMRRWDWVTVDLEPLLPPSAVVSGAVKSMRLRAVCERSGLVFFAAMHGDGGHEQQGMALYALAAAASAGRLVPFMPAAWTWRPT